VTRLPSDNSLKFVIVLRREFLNSPANSKNCGHEWTLRIAAIQSTKSKRRRKWIGGGHGQ
jgi:hypothetical protein